jgi:hypothetical protein
MTSISDREAEAALTTQRPQKLSQLQALPLAACIFHSTMSLAQNLNQCRRLERALPKERLVLMALQSSRL